MKPKRTKPRRSRPLPAKHNRGVYVAYSGGMWLRRSYNIGVSMVTA